MSVVVASWIVGCIALYLALGLAFALAFVVRGVDRIDPAAQGASLGFRLLVLPGSALLWPILVRRWIAKAPPPVERNAHRDAAGAGSEAP